MIDVRDIINQITYRIHLDYLGFKYTLSIIVFFHGSIMRAYIETERLILKNLMPEDYLDMFKWCGNPNVAKYMIYPTYTSANDCKKYIESLNPDNPDICDLGIFSKETGEAIGSGGFKYISKDDTWEVGYNLRQDMWGKGIVLEAMNAILLHIQECRVVRSISGTFAEENIKSKRVMEKIGMSYWYDCSFTKIDGSESFKAIRYRKEMQR